MHPSELKEIEPKPIESTIPSKLWIVLFAIMYPVITAFGLLFTGIVAVFSAISSVFVFVLKRIKN